ncbi:hypothetical protein AVEN_58975-2-1, partial [Araneus ventricosus]
KLFFISTRVFDTCFLPSQNATYKEVTLKQAIHRFSKLEFLEHGKEKPIVEVENLSNSEQIIRSGGIQKNLKSKTQSADSNLRLRWEGSGKTKDLPTLAPLVEAGN